MSDAAFILSVLEDGLPHSTNDLIAKSQAERGCGVMVHSRVADLRKRGHYIICNLARRENGRPIYEYQLVASSPTPPLSDGPPLLEDPDGKHDHADVGRGGAEEESEQVPLFTYPRSPAWS